MLVMEQAGTKTHIVKSGDSLWKLGKQYNTTIEAICKANAITPDQTLHIGESLAIPEVKNVYVPIETASE